MNTQPQRERLLARRAELLGDLHDIEDALDAPVSQDWEDRASERQGDEVLESLGIAEQHEVKRIDAALARIEAGTYGTCLQCGEPIADARLEIVPDTALCHACAGV